MENLLQVAPAMTTPAFKETIMGLRKSVTAQATRTPKTKDTREKPQIGIV